VIRILQVSDTHLSPRSPVADAHWAAVLAHIAASSPDLVVHTGDISLDGANHLSDLEHARSQLDRITVPWLAIPGNHDIGDIGDDPGSVDPTRQARYRSVFGEAFWSHRRGQWHLLGLDIQTMLSGSGGESWWRWLEAELGSDEGPVAVFVHRPLLPMAGGEVDAATRYVTEPGRSRLIELLDGADVRLVASGHVHQWRSVRQGARSNVWAPATWAVLPDTTQPIIGTKVVGVVEHELGESVTSTVVTPQGMATVVCGEDVPDPYAH
jgi:alkaline phosphatase D